MTLKLFWNTANNITIYVLKLKLLIFSTQAPVSEVSIDSVTNYKEGDRMTFNCSSKVDPDYSYVSVELIKASTVLTTLSGPTPGTNRTSDCSVDFSWVSSPPNPLTTNENDVIVRCVVNNKLLNITKTAEKMLNVSAAGMWFETIENLCVILEFSLMHW